MRTLAIVAVAVFAIGCKSPLGTDYTSTKLVIFEEGSIVLNPPKTEVMEGSYESSDGTELDLPDGSHLKLTGGGAAGNIIIIPTQNDGTEQKVKTDAKADLTADVTPPGEGPKSLDVVGR